MTDMEAYDKLPKSVRLRLQDALGNRDPNVVREWKRQGVRARNAVKAIEAWDRADNAGIARAGLMPQIGAGQSFQLIPKRTRRR